MMGRGLSKAGVDKDPVISPFLMEPDLGLILIYRNIANIWKELFNKWKGVIEYIFGEWFVQSRNRIL